MDLSPFHFGFDDDVSTSDSDEDFLDEIDEEWAAVWVCALTLCNTIFRFNANELEGQFTVNHSLGVRDVLATLRKTPDMFKDFTNFTENEFDELASLVVPTISNHARSTGLLRGVGGRPSKLSSEQRLLNFIMFMKHDNSIKNDAYTWNWNPGSTCDDALFIASCINASIGNEIRWPSPEERRELAGKIPEFPGCIGVVDGTLIKIRRPFNNREHSRWFNGRKKIYSMNNTLLIDQNGFFIHVDIGYPGSFHNANILRQSEVYNNWRQYFHREDGYFEYVLGDLGNDGADMFIVQQIEGLEIHPPADGNVMTAYNKMHSGYRVRVEWGIGGLKRKWRKLMKRFDSRKPKYCQLFRAAALLTNFLHRRRMDFCYEIVGEQHVEETNYGWEGDF